MIIAFDAAKRTTGWAYRKQTPGKPPQWITGTLSPRDTQTLIGVVQSAVLAGCSKTVIENCYLGKSGNVHVVKMLQEAQTRIRMACESAGLPVELIYPQTWQSAYGIVGCSQDRKRGAYRVATMLGADSKITNDEADAVCLCDFATRKGHQDELALVGPRGGKMPWAKAGK